MRGEDEDGGGGGGRGRRRRKRRNSRRRTRRREEEEVWLKRFCFVCTCAPARQRMLPRTPSRSPTRAPPAPTTAILQWQLDVMTASFHAMVRRADLATAALAVAIRRTEDLQAAVERERDGFEATIALQTTLIRRLRLELGCSTPSDSTSEEGGDSEEAPTSVGESPAPSAVAPRERSRSRSRNRGA